MRYLCFLHAMLCFGSKLLDVVEFSHSKIMGVKVMPFLNTVGKTSQNLMIAFSCMNGMIPIIGYIVLCSHLIKQQLTD